MCLLRSTVVEDISVLVALGGGGAAGVAVVGWVAGAGEMAAVERGEAREIEHGAVGGAAPVGGEGGPLAGLSRL